MSNQLFTRTGLWLSISATVLLSAGCGGDDNDENMTYLPDTPDSSVEVTTKSIELSWQASDGANFYRVLRDADGSSGFTDISGNLVDTKYSTPLAAHLTDWNEARFIVEACNSQGCTSGEELYINDSILEAIGYLKPKTIHEDSIFGFSIAISGDSSTLAVGAPKQDYRDDSSVSKDAGSVTIFSNINGQWEFSTQIDNPYPEHGAFDLFGYSLALNATGDTLLVGTPSEGGAGRSINATEKENRARNSGAAYLYKRQSGQWHQDTYFKAANADPADYFGMRVAMTPDARKIAVSAPYEASNSAGVNNSDEDNSIELAGAVYLFELEDEQWQQTQYIKPSTPSHREQLCFDPRPPGSGVCYERSPSRFGYGLAMSKNGDVLAIGAPGDSSISAGINGAENDYRGNNSGAVHILRLIDNNWTHTDYIKASNPGIDDEFGYSLDLSADGTTLAVGAPHEDQAYSGITPPNNENQDNLDTEQDSGAAYLFKFDQQAWQQTAYLKAEHADEDDFYGWSLALSSNGDVLAIGAPRDDSDAEGVTSDWANNGAPSAGAAYVYSLENLDWSLTNYLKASNTNANDTFGRTVTISHDGNTLAVSATGEDSQATGVNGDQTDNSTEAVGAVYLY
jgi:hypothetical protein